MTLDEIHAQAARRPGRMAIIVREDDDGFAAEWDGQEVRATLPFKLDTLLDSLGAPVPRDLYLLTDGEGA